MSKSKQNHIHINGRHYDATTGQPLDGQPLPAPKSKTVITHHQSAVHHTPKPGPHPHAPVHRAAPNHAHPHAPRPAHTLMRRAVKPPAKARPLRIQGHLSVPADIQVVPKPSAHHVHEPRAHHARHAHRSLLITHFGAEAVYTPAPAPHIGPVRHASASHHQPPAQRRRHVIHRRHSPSTEDVLAKALAHADSFRELPVK